MSVNPTNQLTILVVEDDPSIRETTSLLLETFGHRVEAVADGMTALRHCRASLPDLVIVDVMLPQLDGISLTRTLRSESSVPILMLSARDQSVDVIAGLEAGADDYVTKPFEGAVLIARINSLVRRASLQEAAGTRLQIGNLVIDYQAMATMLNGDKVKLTATEFRLLKAFTDNLKQVLTRELLLELVWGYEFGGDTRMVDVHVQRLRSKIGPDLIETVRGTGYKLMANRDT